MAPSRYLETQQQEQQQETWKEYIWDMFKHLVTVIVCGYILMISDVFNVMWNSKRVFRNVLYVSYAAYAVFFSVWLYVLLFIQPTNPNPEKTHMHLIYVATASVTLGGFLWAIAIWPVFHIWTIPLGIAGLFGFLSLLALIPAKKKKLD